MQMLGCIISYSLHARLHAVVVLHSNVSHIQLAVIARTIRCSPRTTVRHLPRRDIFKFATTERLGSVMHSIAWGTRFGTFGSLCTCMVRPCRCSAALWCRGPPAGLTAAFQVCTLSLRHTTPNRRPGPSVPMTSFIDRSGGLQAAQRRTTMSAYAEDTAKKLGEEGPTKEGRRRRRDKG